MEEIAGAAREARGGFWQSSGPEVSNLGFTGYEATLAVSSVGLRIARTVPEPGHLVLVATGGLVLAALARRDARRGQAPPRDARRIAP